MRWSSEKEGNWNWGCLHPLIVCHTARIYWIASVDHLKIEVMNMHECPRTEHKKPSPNAQTWQKIALLMCMEMLLQPQSQGFSPRASLVLFQGLASSGLTQQLAQAALYDQLLSSKSLTEQFMILLFQVFYQGKKPSSKTTPYWQSTTGPLWWGLRHYKMCFKIVRKAFLD